MTDIIEVTDNLTGENFAVDPDEMHYFLHTHTHINTTAETTGEYVLKALQVIDEIERICQEVRMNESGSSRLLHIDYAPGIYRGALPACGWIKEED